MKKKTKNKVLETVKALLLAGVIMVFFHNAVLHDMLGYGVSYPIYITTICVVGITLFEIAAYKKAAGINRKYHPAPLNMEHYFCRVLACVITALFTVGVMCDSILMFLFCLAGILIVNRMLSKSKYKARRFV